MGALRRAARAAMRALAVAGRAAARAVFVVFIIVVAIFPWPVMPIVFVVQRWRRREDAAEVMRKERP